MPFDLDKILFMRISFNFTFKRREMNDLKWRHGFVSKSRFPKNLYLKQTVFDYPVEMEGLKFWFSF